MASIHIAELRISMGCLSSHRLMTLKRPVAARANPNRATVVKISAFLRWMNWKRCAICLATN